MPKFLVANLRKETIRLGIEPWAHLEVMQPDAQVEFEYDEPAELEFSLDEDGGATVE